MALAFMRFAGGRQAFRETEAVTGADFGVVLCRGRIADIAGALNERAARDFCAGDRKPIFGARSAAQFTDPPDGPSQGFDSVARHQPTGKEGGHPPKPGRAMAECKIEETRCGPGRSLLRRARRRDAQADPP